MLTLLLPIIFIARKWFSVRLLIKLFPFLQSLSEIIIVAGIIYATGSVNSAFSGLFILTIISAALVCNLAGTLGIASIISVSYAFIIWFGLSILGVPGSSVRALETIFSSQDVAFYSIFLHILTYLLVAFISGFLVERLKMKDRELANTSNALRKARLETDDILKHLNSGLITIDGSGRIIYFNRAGEDILGFREEDIRGKDFRLVFNDRLPDLVESLQSALESRPQKSRIETNLADRYGHVIPIGLSTSLLLDDNESIRGVIVIFQDLTETKAMEDKIRAADKMAAVGELSAAIAHEIRNPMAAISGSVEVLKSELNLSNENKKLMDLIIKESCRLNDILSDFLLYARSKRSIMNRVELCRLISDVFEIARHHPSFTAGIDLNLSTDDSYLYVFGDEDQLKQILINLVVNSCQAFEKKGGEITVCLERAKSGGIVMVVSDNGPGIDKRLLSRVFDPFFSTKSDGTGLGLAIVLRLTGNLDIDLSLKTEAGKGTSFILEFTRIPGDNGQDRPAQINAQSPIRTII
jgi:two-component system sensor histidine kinase PilS (NtrC family)